MMSAVSAIATTAAAGQNQIFTVSENAAAASTVVENGNVTAPQRRRGFKDYSKQPFFDVLIIVIGLPSLLILGLMLEAMTRENWPETTQSRLSVLGLGAAFAVLCLALCLYVTSRLGRKFLWVGPLYTEDMGSPAYSYYNSRAVNDLPPKYDTVIGLVDDIPPPAYDTLIFEDEKQFMDAEKCPKYAIQHI